MYSKKAKIRAVGSEVFLPGRTLGGEAIPRSMTKKLFVLLVGAVCILHVAGAQPSVAPSPVKDEQIIITKTETEEPKRDHMDVWLDRLVGYECPGCGPNYRRVDVNGHYSYGCLQFQEATFRSYAKRYHIFTEGEPYTSDSLYSCELQKRIAREMWNEMGSSYEFGRNWYTSIYKKGLGLP